jgi:TRAP-type C4-dicarboxylate transport system permease small subunit
MEGKARFIFPVVITAIIAFIVSGALTFFDIGWRNDFVTRWWSAFAIGWPIAASTAYLALPFAHSLTRRIVATIEQFDLASADTPSSCDTCTTQKEHEP